jgi:hypothetical protein
MTRDKEATMATALSDTGRALKDAYWRAGYDNPLLRQFLTKGKRVGRCR